MSAIAFNRLIGPIPINVVVSEDHTSEIEITSNPIETGAEVNDHSYVMPKRVTLECASAYAAAVYNSMVKFQETRIPFVLVTGLSVYRNMLIKSINATRDFEFSRILKCTVDLQEIIIVDTTFAASQAGTDAPPSGEPGGVKSSLSAKVTPTRALDAQTADRVSGIVQRGDQPFKTVTLPKTMLAPVFARP